MSNHITLPKGYSLVSPYLTVKDVTKAVEFYQHAFGFEKKDLAPGQDGSIIHAEMYYKDQLLMFGKESVCEEMGMKVRSPQTSGTECPITIYIYCVDVDKFHADAVAAGAKSLAAPAEMFWGDRMCRLEDLDGYVWAFATHLGQKHHK